MYQFVNGYELGVHEGGMYALHAYVDELLINEGINVLG